MKIILSAEEFRSLADALVLSTPFEAVVGMVKEQVPAALIDAMRDGNIRLCATCGEWNVMRSPGEIVCSDCLEIGSFS